MSCVFRGDADDLGTLLASEKPHAILLPHDEGETSEIAEVPGTTSHSSSHAVQDDGNTRREEQHDVYLTQGGDGNSSTFVRREEHTTVTTTTSTTSGEVNDSEGGGGGVLKFTATVGTDEYESAPINISPVPAVAPPRVLSPQPEPVMAPLTVDVAQSSSMTTSLSLSPGATLISPSAASSSYSSKAAPPPVSPKPARSPGGVPRGPTFKAQPPRMAPEVAPKPVVVGGQVVTSDPLLSPKPQFQIRPTFNAKAVAQVAQPHFQVQATAMYSHQPTSPQPFSPQSRGPPAFKQQQYQQQQQQQQAYQSPAYSPQQPAFSKQTSRQISTSSTTTSSKQQMFLPLSVQTPDSAPYSPSSPGVYSMFNVRNNVGDGKVVWQPNMWLEGKEPAAKQSQQQQQRQRHQDVANNNAEHEVEVPRHLSIRERQQQLLHHAARKQHSLSARQSDPTFDAPPEHVQREMQHRHHHHLPVFAPPVAIVPDDEQMESDSGSASPTSSILRRSECSLFSPIS